jgi:ABC-type multidrug transport system fused ATPase/permease subunit
MNKEDLLERMHLQKSVHSYYYAKTRVYAIVVKILMLLLPAIITYLSVSEIGDIGVRFINNGSFYNVSILSLISFILFILSVYIEVFNIDVKSKLHRNAINRLTKLRQEYSQELENYPKKDKEITEKYRELYIEIIESSPQFSDRQFIKGKKYYIKMTAEKLELDKELSIAKEKGNFA